MIQRIQTLFLVIVAIASGLLPFVFKLWEKTDGGAVYAKDNLWVLLSFLTVAVLALIAIFQFRKRQHQFVINRLNLIVNLFY